MVEGASGERLWLRNEAWPSTIFFFPIWIGVLKILQGPVPDQKVQKEGKMEAQGLCVRKAARAQFEDFLLDISPSRMGHVETYSPTTKPALAFQNSKK